MVVTVSFAVIVALADAQLADAQVAAKVLSDCCPT